MSDFERDQVNAMLTDPQKRVGEATGILSKLFRKILIELNVTPVKWNALMNAYLNDPRNRVPRDNRGRSSTRGNLNKELRKPAMTWANMEKAIRFLNPLKAEFTIKLTWRGGRTTVHSLSIGEESSGEEEKTE